MERLFVSILILWCIATLYALFGHKFILKEKKVEQSILDYDDPQVKLWLEVIFSKPQKKVYIGKSFTK